MKNNTLDHDPIADIVNAINSAMAGGANPAFVVTTLEMAKLDIISAMRRKPEPVSEKPSIIRPNG